LGDSQGRAKFIVIALGTSLSTSASLWHDRSEAWVQSNAATKPVNALVTGYLDECRALVLSEIESFVPKRTRYRSALYDLMLDYPLREAKALRPALCIAASRALGGSLEGVLKSAAVLELYHNAFLIHDDVEDGSEKRRDGPTLHRAHGVPIAINVGDAMLALALEPLLDNMRLLGLGKALRILQAVARMARESAEGQALELSWIRTQQWQLADADYLRMVHKKTGHYTFITPVLIGGIVAGAAPQTQNSLVGFATALGLAFQIRDDVLNLAADEQAYGKELNGDLWEGKHTLVLLHALRNATAGERKEALRILSKQRPLETVTQTVEDLTLQQTVDHLLASGAIEGAARSALLRAREGAKESDLKTPAEISFLAELIQRYRSMDHADAIARRRALLAQRLLSSFAKQAKPSVHMDFLWELTSFVVERDR
jgi:geranylgeranyl diphosphate synthase, type II